MNLTTTSPAARAAEILPAYTNTILMLERFTSPFVGCRDGRS